MSAACRGARDSPLNMMGISLVCVCPLIIDHF